MIEKLDDIYQNPSYYVGCCLRDITGNMRYIGSVAAEINHSSAVVYLGEGANWTMEYQIMKLMQRQQPHYIIYCKQEDEESIFNEYYQSKYDGTMGNEDKLAKKALAPHVHK